VRISPVPVGDRLGLPLVEGLLGRATQRRSTRWM
jgi:hypothetical protein